MLVGVILTLLGAFLAVIGLLYLRRNFSVFVEVRDVVLHGPYRFCRHPLYAGEIAMLVGIILTAPSVFGLIIGTLFIAVQYWRARMEEAQLRAVSPEYEELMQQAGMFLPRLRSR
jgi:protein-S-isoprenylcysteine O-methyltransferase Ste14